MVQIIFKKKYNNKKTFIQLKSKERSIPIKIYYNAFQINLGKWK